jgi:hypothetical protein
LQVVGGENAKTEAFSYPPLALNMARSNNFLPLNHNTILTAIDVT